VEHCGGSPKPLLGAFEPPLPIRGEKVKWGGILNTLPPQNKKRAKERLINIPKPQTNLQKGRPFLSPTSLRNLKTGEIKSLSPRTSPLKAPNPFGRMVNLLQTKNLPFGSINRKPGSNPN